MNRLTRRIARRFGLSERLARLIASQMTGGRT